MAMRSSNSHDHNPKGFLATEKSLHAILGGGKAADILLWRNNKLSAAILTGSTIIWSLFKVGEYNFVTLLCHISIITMMILFLWSSGADLIVRNPPGAKTITIPESTVHWMFVEINKMLSTFYRLSSGQDLKTFFLAIAFLWILSGVGNYFSSLDLLYIGFLGLMSLPALYEQYQNQMDYFAVRAIHYMKELYGEIEKKFLNKIPRGPTREKKKF